MSSDPFATSAGRPRLAQCAVLFLDLLGVRAMNRGPRREVERHLRDLEAAVTGGYRDYLRPESIWPAAFFSDTLVLAAPAARFGSDASAVEGLVLQAGRLQASLLRRGFFARGGLSVGLFHIRDGLIFGPALADAYELESQRAVHPRVVLSDEAIRCLRQTGPRRIGWVPTTHDVLLEDDDGSTFVNYLDLVSDDPDEPGVLLQTHRDHIADRLARHRDDKRVWEKYRWAAEYHNDFVRRQLGEASELEVGAAAMTWRFSPFA